MRMTTAGVDDWTKPDSKIKQALRVLPRVLADLPPGTPLSVRVFGHRRPPPLPAGLDENQAYALEAKNTPRERIFEGPVTWGPKNTARLDQLMDQLNAFMPQGGTPLVQSMIEAQKNDFPADFRGPRTLLVLTDGMDTWYGKTDAQDRAKRDFENAFREADVTVQMVLFRAGDEGPVALRQFGDVVNFRMPGFVDLANDPAALAQKLNAALLPKLRVLTPEGEPAEGVKPTGLPANRADAPLEGLRAYGPLKPQLYQGVMYGTRQLLRLDRGDRLLIKLHNAGDGVRFERGLFADELAERLREGRRKDQGAWVLGVPQVLNDETRQGRLLRLLTTLETTRGKVPGRDGVLQQTPPGSVWWDLAPAGEAVKTGPLRVNRVYGYPAPAWEMTVDDWPADPEPRKASLKVWCAADLPPVARRLTVTPTRDPGPEQDVELEDGSKVWLSVALEAHPLRTQADMIEPPSVPCLVVRARFAADRPVQVQLGDLVGVPPPTGQEHRYYGSVNYTALFGSLTPDQVAGKRIPLEVVSVPRLKAGATEIGQELPTPRPNDPRPQPLKLIGEREGR
jgi:hypothetical protein